MQFKKPAASGTLRPWRALLRGCIGRVCAPCKWQLWFRPAGPALVAASADRRGSILAGEQNLATSIRDPRWSPKGESPREISGGPARLAIAVVEKTAMPCAPDDLRIAWKSFRTSASRSVPSLRSLFAKRLPADQCPRPVLIRCSGEIASRYGLEHLEPQRVRESTEPSEFPGRTRTRL